MTIYCLTGNYLYWSKVEGAAAARGKAVVLVKTSAALMEAIAAGAPPSGGAGGFASAKAAVTPATVFVDLAHPEALASLPLCAERGARTIAFVGHAETAAIAAARAAGASQVLPKSEFFRRLQGLASPPQQAKPVGSPPHARGARWVDLPDLLEEENR